MLLLAKVEGRAEIICFCTLTSGFVLFANNIYELDSALLLIYHMDYEDN